jgi:uncharacterized sulfatase
MSLDKPSRRLPDLAVRDGKWKLLCDYDGSNPRLFDLLADPGEARNLAGEQPENTARLTMAVFDWHLSMPADRGRELGGNRPPAAPDR